MLVTLESRLIVPAALLNDIYCLLADERLDTEESGSMQVTGDTPYYLSHDVEAQARYRWRIGRFYLWLKKNCRIVGSRALATLEPAERTRLVGALGFSAASAIAIAADQNAALWTDEFIASKVAQVHSVQLRVWTLRLIEVLHERGAISEQQNNDTGCDLLASGSRHFLLPERIIARALERSSSDPNVWPLNGICRWFANGTTPPEVVLTTLCVFLKMLHSRTRLISQEDAVVDAVMRALSEHPAHVDIGVALIGQLETLFRFEIHYRGRPAARITQWLAD
jgi:hypothetical protein